MSDLKELIVQELGGFFEWPSDVSGSVTTTSAMLFAEHVAQLYADHIHDAGGMAAPAVQGEPVPWGFCPECGSDDANEYPDMLRVCNDCGQDWHADVDYTDATRANLSRANAHPQSGQGAEPQVIGRVYRDVYGKEGEAVPVLNSIGTTLADGAPLYSHPQPARQGSVPEGWRERVAEMLKDAHCEGQRSATGRDPSPFRWVNSESYKAAQALLLAPTAPAVQGEPEGQAIGLLARVQGWWQNTDGDMPASLEQDIAALLAAAPQPTASNRKKTTTTNKPEK